MHILAFFTIFTLAYGCNPLQGSCPSDPALAATFGGTFLAESPYFSAPKRPGSITYNEDGVSLTMKKRGDNPTLISNFYILFGKVEVVLKAALGQGIVSLFYLQSDTMDEIDIELFGGDPYEFLSNYFSQGDTKDFNRGGYHPISSDPRKNFHTYTIEWTPDFVTWSLDGKVVRKLGLNSPQGFPQTPMRIYTGVWAGGDPSNAQGTINWAGGLTNYSEAPFTMQIYSMIVADYSSGNSYKYTDKSGKWELIDADGGKVMGRYEDALEQFDLGGDQISTSFKPDKSLQTESVNSLQATAGPTGSAAENAGKILVTSDGSTFATTIPKGSITLAGEASDNSTSGATAVASRSSSNGGSTTKRESTASSSRVSSSSYSMIPIEAGQPITEGGSISSAGDSGGNGNPSYANHPYTASLSLWSSYMPYSTLKHSGSKSQNGAVGGLVSHKWGLLSLLMMAL